MDNRLVMYGSIRVDSPDTIIPGFGYDQEILLNKQTGFNRSLLSERAECGCFHCGRRFPTSLVTTWMHESGEEDTGCCPYCGSDTLIVGSEELPLTTTLLTLLYQHWFPTECEERKALATDIPPYRHDEDYLRRGIPFRWGIRPGRKQIAQVRIWSVGNPGEYESVLDGGIEPGVYDDAPFGGVSHVRVWEEMRGGCPVVRFELWRDGLAIPFKPFRELDRMGLQSFYQQYGERLLGAFKDDDPARMAVLVDE